MRLSIRWKRGIAQARGTLPDGTRFERSLGTSDPTRAEFLRSQLEHRLWREAMLGKDAVVTFDEAALAYAKDGGDTRFLVPIAEALEGRPLRSITPGDIRDLARRLYPKAANATRNRQVIVPARAVINFAHREGWCASIHVDAFPVQRPRREAVGMDYLLALRPHLQPRLYALMLFLHQTGRRVGDAIAMEPSWVRGTTVFIPRTKNGDPAAVLITDEVAALIAALEPRHGRVFGYKDRSAVYKPLRRACEKAGVPYLGTHQPGRHSFATTLKAAGLSSRAVAEAGGWKSTRMVDDVYDHPTEAHAQARAVFSKVSGFDPDRPKSGGDP